MTARQPFALDYFAPAPDLRAMLSSYYVFRADLPRVSDVMRADLAQLRFMIRGDGHYRLAGGRCQRTPKICLIGPTTSATAFDVDGPLLVFGVGIHPAGWATMVRDDASLSADQVIDATAVFGPLLADAIDAMRDAGSAAEMVAIVDAVMRALLSRAAIPPLWFTALTDAWLLGDTSPEVDALVARTGMSARQVERLARRFYGAPPKLLARKYRALRAASLIGAQGYGWAEAAGDAFYDQSHFIREFKRFTGLTPRQYRNSPTPVTRLSNRRSLVGRIADIAAIS